MYTHICRRYSLSFVYTFINILGSPDSIVYIQFIDII